MKNGNTYIIPANSKKSQLILSYFTLLDLIVFAVGVTMSILLLLFAKDVPFWVMICFAMPAFVSGFLILPLPPHYHNIMTFIGNFNRYITGVKKYYWRGWCASYGDRTTKR